MAATLWAMTMLKIAIAVALFAAGVWEAAQLAQRSRLMLDGLAHMASTVY